MGICASGNQNVHKEVQFVPDKSMFTIDNLMGEGGFGRVRVQSSVLPFFLVHHLTSHVNILILTDILSLFLKHTCK